MNVPGTPPPLVSVGKLLRRARESQDLEIADIAAELCLDQRYLRAIEVDDLPSLPGAFFYRSFVRQYGARLGVDPQTLKSAVETFMLPAAPQRGYRAGSGGSRGARVPGADRSRATV